jgi:hypothetical protein
MPAVVVAVVLAALYLVLDPPSADLAAQTYRVGLFDREGLIAWDNQWYGGHHLPGYSVLFPPLASLLGLQVVGALSIVAATIAVTRLTASTAAATWFAVGMTAAVASGRLTFALGVAFGAAAMAAVAHGTRGRAAALGALTALASPVAALFVAMIAAAIVLTGMNVRFLPTGRETTGVRRAGLALAVAAVMVTAALVLAFPEGGTEPFVSSAFWPALAAALIAAACTGGAVRTAAILYALLLVAAFAIDNPLGGNAARLGALVGGPLAIARIRDRRILVLAAIPLAYWTLYPVIRDVRQAHGDPARAGAYYEPLLDRLRNEPLGRLEIPFTEGHWEAARVAPAIPIARGWERQLDRKVNALFYADELTAERYRRWLKDNAVHWVALPDAPLDYSARAEAALIEGGLPYLDEIWHDEHWRLFAVTDAEPLGATAMGPDWFTTTGGTVKVRWTPYWALVEGAGCLRRGNGDWTVVEPRPRGAEVRVAIRINPARALSRGPRCR